MRRALSPLHRPGWKRREWPGHCCRGGIVREPELRERAIERARAAAEACGLRVLGVQPSRLPGAEGNQEFFLHAARGGAGESPGAKR